MPFTNTGNDVVVLLSLCGWWLVNIGVAFVQYHHRLRSDTPDDGAA